MRRVFRLTESRDINQARMTMEAPWTYHDEFVPNLFDHDRPPFHAIILADLPLHAVCIHPFVASFPPWLQNPRLGSPSRRSSHRHPASQLAQTSPTCVSRRKVLL